MQWDTSHDLAQFTIHTITMVPAGFQAMLTSPVLRTQLHSETHYLFYFMSRPDPYWWDLAWQTQKRSAPATPLMDLPTFRGTERNSNSLQHNVITIETHLHIRQSPLGLLITTSGEALRNHVSMRAKKIHGQMALSSKYGESWGFRA